MPSSPTSSRRPMKGLTRNAPALATSSAWRGWKHSVMLVRRPSDVSVLQARRPSTVLGSFTTMLDAILAFSRPSFSITAYSVEITSAETGPRTTSQISARRLAYGTFSLAISEGLVVTPSSTPISWACLISSRLAVSMYRSMGGLLCRVVSAIPSGATSWQLRAGWCRCTNRAQSGGSGAPRASLPPRSLPRRHEPFQLTPHDLARGVPREFLDDPHERRALVAGEPPGAPGQEQ